MLTVPISNHPTTGLAREVENRRVIIAEHERVVCLELEVFQLDKEGNRIPPFHQTTLTATDEFTVDAEGNVVEYGSEAAVMTQFEHYLNIAENTLTKVNDLRRAAILRADKAGKFNL